MRLRLPYRGLIILSSLPSLAISLPFSPFAGHTQRDANLVPRASYSVVAVDGGTQAAASGDPDSSPEATVTVVQTVIQTAAPATPDTLIIVSTEVDIVPAGTETVLATTTVPGQNSVETSILTVLPPAVTIVSTDIRPETILATTTLAATNVAETSIVTVEQPAVTFIASPPEASTIYITTLLDTPSQSSSLITSTLHSLRPSSTYSSSSSSTESQTSSSKLPTHSSSTTSYQPSSSSSSPTSSTAKTSISSLHVEDVAKKPTKTSTTYDNGMWHTTYPAWSNNTVATHVPRRPHDQTL